MQYLLHREYSKGLGNGFRKKEFSKNYFRRKLELLQQGSYDIYQILYNIIQEHQEPLSQIEIGVQLIVSM
jgi:hypothetical protein